MTIKLARGVVHGKTIELTEGDSSLISTAALTQTTVQQVVGCGFRCWSGRGELPWD